jgi:hypothetical protein
MWEFQTLKLLVLSGEPLIKRAGKKIWYGLNNPAECKIAKEISAFYHVDKIKSLCLWFKVCRK